MASNAPPEEAEGAAPAKEEHHEEEEQRPFTLFIRPIEPSFEDVLVQVKIAEQENEDLWVSEVVVLWWAPKNEAVNVPIPLVQSDIFATKIGGPLEKGIHQLHASITWRDQHGSIRKIAEQSSTLLVPDMVLKEAPFVQFPEEEHHEEVAEDHEESEVEEAGGIGLAGIVLFIVGIGAGCGAMVAVPKIREKGIKAVISALKDGLGNAIGLIKEKIAKLRSKGAKGEESGDEKEEKQGPVVAKAEKVTKTEETADEEKIDDAEIEAAVTETKLAVDEEQKTVVGEAEPEEKAEGEDALELNEADLEGLEALEEMATEDTVEAVNEVVDQATEGVEAEEKKEEPPTEVEENASVEEKEGLAF